MPAEKGDKNSLQFVFSCRKFNQEREKERERKLVKFLRDQLVQNCFKRFTYLVATALNIKTLLKLLRALSTRLLLNQQETQRLKYVIKWANFTEIGPPF